MPATIARKRPTLDQVRRWPATCTVAEAALALGVSRATLYEALAPRRAARPGGPGEPQDPGPDALAGRRARGPGGGVTGLTSLELCAGAGGTALGLEQAGFTHAGLAETDADCCRTLRANRPGWPVAQCDIVRVDAGWFAGIDLISAGLPCTPHSRGGAQLGAVDERHLWDTALRITSEARPRAVMLETADAILTPRFAAERAGTLERLHGLGYRTWWQVIDASGHGVPQRRRRAVLVAFREAAAFTWPAPLPGPPPAVGDVLFDLVAERGWPGAAAWRDRARDAAPVVTGGSKKHGGADLGASQGKAAWRRLGIDPMGIADEAPGPDGKFSRGSGKTFDAAAAGVMLTVRMAARIQGFSDEWVITGRKTATYRQVGNALPPPVARALGVVIAAALRCRTPWPGPVKDAEAGWPSPAGR